MPHGRMSGPQVLGSDLASATAQLVPVEVPQVLYLGQGAKSTPCWTAFGGNNRENVLRLPGLALGGLDGGDCTSVPASSRPSDWRGLPSGVCSCSLHNDCSHKVATQLQPSGGQAALTFFLP